MDSAWSDEDVLRVKYVNVVGRALALRVSFRERVCIICSEDGQRVDSSLNHLLSPECQKPSSTLANHRTQMIKLEQNCKKPDPKQESAMTCSIAG